MILEPAFVPMVLLAGVAGLCFAPITACQFAAVDELSPTGHKAEAFTWLSTLYGAGLGLGAALAGQLIVNLNTRAALAAASLATLFAYVLTMARRRSLMSTPTATET